MYNQRYHVMLFTIIVVKGDQVPTSSESHVQELLQSTNFPAEGYSGFEKVSRLLVTDLDLLKYMISKSLLVCLYFKILKAKLRSIPVSSIKQPLILSNTRFQAYCMVPQLSWLERWSYGSGKSKPKVAGWSPAGTMQFPRMWPCMPAPFAFWKVSVAFISKKSRSICE